MCMTILLPLLAEVADKEPTITEIWCIAAFLSVIALVLGHLNRYFGLAVLPFATIFAMGLLDELHDPFVGPALVNELGQSYPAQVYAASTSPFLAVAFGFRARKKSAH